MNFEKRLALITPDLLPTGRVAEQNREEPARKKDRPAERFSQLNNRAIVIRCSATRAPQFDVR